MGCWSDYCLICGASFRNYYDWDTNKKIGLDMDLDWLNYSYSITKSGKLIETKLVDCGESFDTVGNKYWTCPLHWEEERPEINPDNMVIACHRNCYKLLQNMFDYEIKFEHVEKLLDEYIGVFADKKFYGMPMIKYSFGQTFNIEGFVFDKWLFEDPLIDNFNKKRIINMWKPFIKKIKQNK